MTTKNEYVSRLVSQGFAVLLTIVISMTGFWMVIGREFTTREEVNRIVNTKMIAVNNEFETRKASDARLEKVLEKNTEAIQGLQVQIATLNVMLESMRRERTDNN